MATATSNAASLSGAYGSNDAPDCTHYTMWNHATERVVADNFLQAGTIATSPDPAPLKLGEKFEIPIGMIVLTQNVASGQGEEMVKRAIRGQILGGVWIDFHTADSGNGRRANLIAVTTAALSAAQFTVA